MAPPTRREFVQSCAAAVALGTSGTSSFASNETLRSPRRWIRVVSGAPTKGTLATVLIVEENVDPKTAQGILRHTDTRA